MTITSSIMSFKGGAWNNTNIKNLLQIFITGYPAHKFILPWSLGLMNALQAYDDHDGLSFFALLSHCW